VENTCKSRNFSRRPIWLSQSIVLAIREILGGIKRNREFPS
jgi:hypothetical protein